MRIIIADDSSFFREVLREALETDGDIQVVGEAATGVEAVALASRLRPDLMTVDLKMPRLDGLEVIEQTMSLCPMPLVLITAQPTADEGGLTFEAISRGALDVLSKRKVAEDPSGAALRALLRRLAAVAVVGRGRRSPGGAEAPHPPPQLVLTGRAAGLLAIGASAGGPPAVAELLGALPADFPAPIALVQHLSPGFTDSYASYLRGVTSFRFQIVGPEPVTAKPGTVLLAPDERHLVALSHGRFGLSATPALRGHRPSVDALFSSLAQVYGEGVVAVVLSGMGEDGARGVAELEAKGAFTIAQDEKTSIVYGMPKAAKELGGSKHVLPLPQISLVVRRVFGQDRG